MQIDSLKFLIKTVIEKQKADTAEKREQSRP